MSEKMHSQAANKKCPELDGILKTEWQAGAGLCPPGTGWGGVCGTNQPHGHGSSACAGPEDKASGPL